MVPEGWKARQIGDVATFSSGGTPSKQTMGYWGGSEPWISGKDLKSHYLRKSIDTLTTEGFAVAKKAPQGSSLILVRGMTLLKDFPVGYASRELAFNQDIKALVPKDHVDGLFLSFLLVAQKHQIRQLVSTAGHGTGRLDTSLVKAYPINLPPLPEQKKIAQILSTWDQAITATERLLENSQQRKKGLMQQLLTGKKRLPGFEGEWTTRELDSLGTTYPGLSGKTKEDFGSGEPFITYMGVFSDGAIKPDGFGYVRISEKESQNKVQYGDILLTTSSETPDEVGMASVLLERLSYSLYLNSFCFGFRANSFEELTPEFSRYLFRGEHVRRRISALAQGATRYNLSKKQFLKLSVFLPSAKEQTAIAKVLATSDKEIRAIKQRIDYLRSEKKALMQQLLTGKRRVKVETEAA